MSDLVPSDEIEAIVGMPRHQWEHYARAVSSEQKVYVLHSKGCLADDRDLRECPYSLALDRDFIIQMPEDEPVLVTVGMDAEGWYLYPLSGMEKG